MEFTVDKDQKQVNVSRVFNAPKPMVWSAWTEAELLDRWWGPAPWKADTIRMDFREGGRWFYAMRGPEGEAHYCIYDYLRITHEAAFETLDAFADERGTPSEEMPRSVWKVSFRAEAEATRVDVVIRYDTLEELETIVEMGFREGFTQGLNQLTELLATLQGSRS